MKTVFMALIGLAGAAPAYAQNVGTTSPFGGARIEGRVGWDRPVASIEADDIHSCAEVNAGLTRAMLNESRIALDVQAEWMIGLGRKTARERLAHLLCEIGLRLGLVMSSKAARYDLPLTQSEMADFTGLTSVHVNRTLKDMRLERLIEQRGQTLHIPDMARLARAGLFTPDDKNIAKRLRDFILVQPDFAVA